MIHTMPTRPAVTHILALPCTIGLLVLAGCATPQQRCINDATRDMEVVDQLIADIEGNLARGYALERQTTYSTEFEDCTPSATPETPSPAPRLCPVQTPITTQRPVAIDLTDESAKLASLRSKRSTQGQIAHQAIAQCRAQFPK